MYLYSGVVRLLQSFGAWPLQVRGLRHVHIQPFPAESRVGVLSDRAPEKEALRIFRPVDFIDQPDVQFESRVSGYGHKLFQPFFLIGGDRLAPGKFYCNRIDLCLYDSTLRKPGHDVEQSRGFQIEGQQFTVRMAEKMLSSSEDVRNCRSVMATWALIFQPGKIADVVTDKRGRIGMQVRYQQASQRDAIKRCSSFTIQLDNYVGMSNVIMSLNFGAFEPYGSDFGRGIIR